MLFIFFLLPSGSKTKKVETEEAKENEKVLKFKTDNVKTDERWMNEAQQRVSNLEEQITAQNQTNLELVEALNEIRNTLSDMQSSPVSNLNQVEMISEDLDSSQVEMDRSISSYRLSLTNKEQADSKFFRNSKHYVAGGAYASGVLISALDATTGINSIADPRPALIRITGNAISAGFKGKPLKTDLSGCVVTAGGVGDISSERVYIKLSKMTCARNKNETFEIDIKGYVSGLGKAGVRGVVVSRDWDKLSKAFASGLISGFGSAYSQSLQPPVALTTGGTAITQQQSLSNALKGGAGKGIQKSGDIISDYYIKRAEQYQPVISIPAGIDIEVVFIEGFSLLPQTQTQNDNNQDTISNNDNL